MDKITMEMFGGEFEDADDQRMVVRILGHRIGTAQGWIHANGHTVLFPFFIREPGLLAFMPDRDLPEKIAVIVDYYTGLIAIIEEPSEKVKSIKDLKLVWASPLRTVGCKA